MLKNCLIYDQQSRHHLKKTNIFIDKGVIQSIGSGSVKAKEIDLKGAILTPGWLDLNANFNDPGLEHKEDLKSGAMTAKYGGITDVALLPNTIPVLESKSDVEYVKSQSGKPINLYPIAALSEGTMGENLTEMLDLHEAGAVAFSDGMKSIWNSELLVKALQYAQKFNGLIISRPADPHLSRNVQMHEGLTSTSLGMRGEPAISEKIQIANQLEILRYAGGRLHFSMVSTADGLKLIKGAKKEGLNVTCDVGINHLRFTDRDVSNFDTNFKIEPPYRSDADRKALIKGVNDGMIDAIVSGHQPQDREGKFLEFDMASPGVISLQTMFAVLISLQDELDLATAISVLTRGPREVLGLDPVSIEKGSLARLAFFDPDAEWTMNDKSNQSKSQNSPFWDIQLRGKSLGIVIDNKIEFNS
ncbi:MAG: amidohydrolase family protein [Cytophagales bacterium]|nr:amidohydrolase family protein [Cytophagales bacterium]